MRTTAAAGRFLQRDPLGYADGPNLYEYCQSAPTVYADPLGLRGSAKKKSPPPKKKKAPPPKPRKRNVDSATRVTKVYIDKRYDVTADAIAEAIDAHNKENPTDKISDADRRSIIAGAVPAQGSTYHGYFKPVFKWCVDEETLKTRILLSRVIMILPLIPPDKDGDPYLIEADDEHIEGHEYDHWEATQDEIDAQNERLAKQTFGDTEEAHAAAEEAIDAANKVGVTDLDSTAQTDHGKNPWTKNVEQGMGNRPDEE